MIEFRDGDELEKDFASIAYLVEKKEYEYFLEQCSEDPVVHWGAHKSVLIMSDRCPGRAQGLKAYLEQKTQLSKVIHLSSLSEVREYIADHDIDILIFAGYQKDEDNYDVSDLLRERNAPAIMYGILDEYIESVCSSHFIRHAFSSLRPAGEFIGYLEGFSIPSN